MKKLSVVLILGVLIILTLIGCNSLEKLDSEFDLEQFEIEIKSKGYEYDICNGTGNVFGPNCTEIILDDNIIVDGTQYIFYDTFLNVYSYENNEEMEKYASLINEDASLISIEPPLEPEWGKTPHFYKKGKIMVTYFGDDEKITNDFKEIMGEQFAGR